MLTKRLIVMLNVEKHLSVLLFSKNCNIPKMIYLR